MKLLKNTLATLLFTLFAFHAFAQFSYGVHGGINLGTFDLSGVDEDETDPQSRLGTLFGVVSELRFSDNLALQGELNFVQKGVKQDVSAIDSIFGNLRVETDIVVNYLELPILLKVGGDFGMLRADALVGPGFGYAMNGKFKNKVTFNGVSESENEAIDFEEDEFARPDVSVHVGGMLTFKASETAKIYVDGRYILGLTDLNTSDGDGEARNRGISLSAGLLFSL